MVLTRSTTALGRARPLAIIAMLSVALVLIGVLGWQSWQLQQSHSSTADSVLREYAILVADEYGRRATAELGYRGYYQLISKLADLGDPALMRSVLESDDSLSPVASLVAACFAVRGGDVILDGRRMSPDVEALVLRLDAEVANSDVPYHSARTDSNAEQIIYARQSLPGGTAHMVGFVVSNAGIREQLGRVFEAGPLLPSSLAGGQVSNDMLFVRVSDPAQVILLDQNPAFDSRLTVSREIGADYQGILDGFRVDVSMDPASAGILIIGGLPESRVPLLVTAMILAIALLVMAIWLFRREHAVMELRSDFVSQVSHELRTPLTQIRMFAETLLLGRATSDDDKRRSLEIINRESQRLSHLVDNILRFSGKADAARVDCRPQRLAPIVKEVCQLVSATAEPQVIQTSVDESLQANVDTDALRQILLNLLDNAIKYGPTDQTIRVSLTRANNAVELAVEDEGPGIPSAERDRVWSPFYRLRREQDTAISGTGIGLSVVKDLVEAMGGRCWIEARDVGARVCIEVPEVRSDG